MARAKTKSPWVFLVLLSLGSSTGYVRCRTSVK